MYTYMIALLFVILFKRHLNTSNAAPRLAGGEEIGGGTNDQRLEDSKHKRTLTLSHPMQCTAVRQNWQGQHAQGEVI